MHGIAPPPPVQWTFELSIKGSFFFYLLRVATVNDSEVTAKPIIRLWHRHALACLYSIGCRDKVRQMLSLRLVGIYIENMDDQSKY